MAGATARELPGIQGRFREYLEYIPAGDTIPDETWAGRHRNIVVLLVAHVPFLFLLGTFTGTEPFVTGATFEAQPFPIVVISCVTLLGMAGLAWTSRISRRARTALASTGLLTSSAMLVYFSGGFIEAHFHFFVMMGVVAVYEDWAPFAIGIGYVAIQHGFFGMSNPEAVYNHPAAQANPWGWALVHAVFILGLAAALMSHWMSIERSREETQQKIAEVRESTAEIEDLEEKQREIEQAKAEAEEANAEAKAKQREVEQLNEELLTRADEVAAAMAAVSEGDLTADVSADADIEAIAEISEAFGLMTRELSATIRDLRDFSGSVETTTRSVLEDAERLEGTQQDQADDMRSFASDLRAQADELEQTVDELSSLSATIEEIAANTDEVSAEASNAATAAETGTETATEAIAAIEAVEENVASLAAVIDDLDERMDDVANSTDLIEGIAEQTNMLALNANIEAARAGTEGEGFAVVADEVKTLADETQSHSAAIETTIQATIADVDRVLEELRETKARIQTGEETMTDAGDAFEDLAVTVEEVDASLDEVARATDDGARTTEAVVDTIDAVASRSRTVAQQSESLADRTEESAGTISTIRAQLEDLADQTTELQAQLDNFECEQGADAPRPAAADD